MAKQSRQSTIDAMNKFYQRELDELKPKEITPRKKNGKPEKEVERRCVDWMRVNNWNVQIFEAKATYDPQRGVWRNQAMSAGVCDCMGSDSGGTAIAVEFKAPGKLSSFNRESNYRQRKFIVDKINSNNFACVVDSVERLELIYIRWLELKDAGGADARIYLLSMLPPEIKKTGLEDDKLFDDE